jgi:DNA helicase-2/ATP-dependent DNA helicase PcrA
LSFTPEQAALIAEPGHVLALAGPGSGKTSTIIEKIARLLQQPGNRVVACSFTREGAEEIRRRLAKRIGETELAKADIRIGTFHSLIADHRKAHGRSPKMLSPAHQMRTLSTAAAEYGETLANVLPKFEEIKYSLIPPASETLPDWFHGYEKHLQTLKVIDLQDLIRLTVYQMALSIRLPEVKESDDPETCSMPIKLAMAAAQYRHELTERYEKIKAQASAETKAGNSSQASRLSEELKRLTREEGALPLLGATHLLIDESQDNDELQFALATLHALTQVPTTLIGDDDQTIYEWRRAMGYPGLMSFAETFGAKIITLGENFRSLRTIVEHADALIRHNDGHRIEKVFVSRRGAGGEIQAEKADTDVQMAVTATEFIKEFSSPFDDPKGRYKLHVATGEFAVLGRNNFVLDDMERSLIAAGVKYVRQGSSILHREAAQYIYDLLGAVYGGDIKGISVMLQIKGVNATLANQVCSEITGKEGAFVDGQMTNFSRFGAGGEYVKQCSAWFEERRREVRLGKHPEVIAEVCSTTKELFPVSGGFDRKNQQNQKSIAVVQKCLMRMRGLVLARVAALQDRDMKHGLDNAVCLMTFHGSKGLEFKRVIIVGADDKSCPGKGELMSERRLFYVAVTRAKDNVLALYSGRPSRYLAEMGLV